jgi:replicative DNA helicase
MPNPSDTTLWLEQLYGSAEHGWLTLFSLDRATGKRATDWAPVHDLDALAQAAARREPTSCVWYGVATRTKRIAGGLRGGQADCDAIPGLWLDIDIVGPGHAGDKLARDRTHAHELLDAFPLRPTVVIDSGGGLQATWLFGEMLPLADAGDLLASWGTTWKRIGDEHGVALDNVFDAARIMRLPGTTNRKEGLARPVAILEADWGRRYGADDIEQHLDAAPAQPTHRTKQAVPYIGPERPGDAYNARHTGGDVLSAHGFTLAHARGGEEHWVRPGKEARDGSSATVYHDDGHTTIWSDTCATMFPGVEVRRPYDPFGLLVALSYRGDHSAATRDLRAKGYGESSSVLDLLPTAPAAKPTPPPAAEPDAPWPPAIPLDEPQPAPPFPVDALPTWIADQVHNVANAIQCNPAIPASSALGALSVAALGNAHIETRRRHLEHTALYLVTVADVSEGKSPAQGAMLAPVYAFEQRQMDAQKAERAKATSRREIAKKAATNAENVAAATGNPEDVEKAAELQAQVAIMGDPPEGRLITSDITPEKVATIMAANAERIAIVSDEPDVLQVDRYGDARKGRNIAIYLQAWSGKPVTVDRQSAPTVKLARPLMSFVVTSQPEPWRAVLADPELRNRGFAQRFMTDEPPPSGVRDHDLERDERDEDIDDRYDHLLGHLADRLGSYGTPLALSLTTDAKRAWKDWANPISARTALGGDMESEKGWVSKMLDSVLRVAALLHLADHAEVVPIPAKVDADVMRRATRIGDYWIGHRTRMLDEVASSIEPRRLLASLRRLAASDAEGVLPGGVLERRAIGRGGPRNMRKIEQYAPVLEVLVRHNLARLIGSAGVADAPFRAQLEMAEGVQPRPDEVCDSARQRATDRAESDGPPPDDDAVWDLSRVSRVSPVKGFSDPISSSASPDQPEPPATHATSATDAPSPPPIGDLSWLEEMDT